MIYVWVLKKTLAHNGESPVELMFLDMNLKKRYRLRGPVELQWNNM